MAKAKKKKTPVEEAWERYQAIQLTPEQKAELRAEMQKKIDRARADGVYEWLRGLRGTVTPSVSWEELREDED